MTSMTVNHPSNQTPPIDLNSLHTPHKLAQFVVNVPSRKAEFAFLFSEEHKNNSDANLNPKSSKFIHQTLNSKNTQYLNVSMSLIKKHKSTKTKKKQKKKHKETVNKRFKPQYTHHNPDEQDMVDEHDAYNPENDSVGAPDHQQEAKKDEKNDLPPIPMSPASRTNVFGDETKASEPQHRDVHRDMINEKEEEEPAPGLTIQPHHQNEISNVSTVVSEGDMAIPVPSNIDAIGAIPVPMEPVIPHFDDLSGIAIATSADAFKYDISMIDTPTQTDIPLLGLNQISIDPHIPQLSMESSTEDDETKNAEEDDAHDLKQDHETSSSSTETEEDDDDEADDDADVGIPIFGPIPSYLEEEEENNICVRIGKVLYENSWTGDMIASSTEFSRREYNALLDVGNIPTDSYISTLVWKIIFYSQKKTKDELINEDKEHIKWYWFDSNDMDSDWKWRKYNVIICQWITEQFELYLKERTTDNKSINFKDCQQKLIALHEEKKNKKHMKQKLNDEEKEEKQQKAKKITIDAYFDKNNNYDHFLLIERNETKNIMIWHKITKNSNDGDEYYREIRLDHRLLGIKPDMIVPNYQPNPSPFAIPPQLAVDS